MIITKTIFGNWFVFFVKNNKASSNIPPLKLSEGDIEVNLFSDSDKATCLNNYFTSISTIDDSTANLPNFVLKTNQLLYSTNIQESEIKDILEILP